MRARGMTLIQIAATLGVGRSSLVPSLANEILSVLASPPTQPSA